MPRYVNIGHAADDFPGSGCAFAGVDLTEGEARRQAPQGARPIARERTERGLYFPRSGWKIRAANE